MENVVNGDEGVLKKAPTLSIDIYNRFTHSKNAEYEREYGEV